MDKYASLRKNVKLRPHQEEAVKKFLKNEGKGIFFHGLGSGKTITSISAVERVKSKKPLILTPASLQKNYKDSLKKFLAPGSGSKYTIMSYEKFRMNPDKYIKDINPDMIVVDEFHRDKDPKSVSFKALKKARPKVKYFLGLTATVIQNRPSEALPLLNLVSNSKIPILNKKEFKKHFIEVKKVYPKGISGIAARVLGRSGEKKVLKNTGRLQSVIKPYIHKSEPTKEFMSNFPKKEIVDINTEMTKEQEKRYKYYTKDLGILDRWRIKHDIPPKYRGRNNFFSKLMRLRQISDTPAAVSPNITDAIKSSGKLSKIIKNLEKHLKANPKNKAVIYSNFTTSSLNPIEKRLTKKKISHGVFSGEVTKGTKAKTVRDYNTDKKRVMLVSPSGGEGLDLKGTTLMQNVDPNWNPAKMQQVYGRAVRYKSHSHLPPKMRKVRIERYISTMKPGFFRRLFKRKGPMTVDQYIYNRAKEKGELTAQMNKIMG